MWAKRGICLDVDQGDTYPHVEHAEIEQWWLAEDSDGLVGDASVAFVTILERYIRKGSRTLYRERHADNRLLRGRLRTAW